MQRLRAFENSDEICFDSQAETLILGADESKDVEAADQLPLDEVDDLFEGTDELQNILDRNQVVADFYESHSDLETELHIFGEIGEAEDSAKPAAVESEPIGGAEEDSIHEARMDAFLDDLHQEIEGELKIKDEIKRKKRQEIESTKNSKPTQKKGNKAATKDKAKNESDLDLLKKRLNSASWPNSQSDCNVQL